MSEQLFARAPDGTRLYVRRRRGPPSASPDTPTAVLCDGIACDGFIWKYLWDDLARRVPVAHWHYRGHGRSAAPADPACIEFVEHVRDLDAVRGALGAPPVVLFGHSMGCQVALESWRLHRERVRAMVLVCGSSGRITHTFRGTNVLAQVLPRLIARVEAHPGMARALWSRVPTDLSLRIALLSGEVDARSIRPEDLMPYMKHMVDIDLSMFLRMLKSAGEHSAADLLPTVDVPVLVIAGDRDQFTPAKEAEEMAAALPQAELMMVGGGTHVVPIERRELVAERIDEFLRVRVGA
jgi:pimeloyl-ACP methyl ester carboxylesterase